ncbi:transmembrane protein 196-like isoform X1 [Lineus longissimus]|uniref:transmembrane protein 196-like isoform X1 n=1 Tax=Lineus longissimus TaxID=88925 RepID=UPI002B4F56EA
MTFTKMSVFGSCLTDRRIPMSMYAVLVTTVAMSSIHILLGFISVIVGIVSSIQAEVWLAHRVSPIWSGGFFIITGILGIFCAQKKTAYVILCFTAFSIVSLVTAVVNIQLLRLGLVNHTTDGQTFQKEKLDILIIIALVAAGLETLICMVSSFVSCRLAKAAKKEMFKKRDGTFHVQVLGEKDVVIVTKHHKKNKKCPDRQALTAEHGGSLTLHVIERKKAEALQKKRQIQMAELLKSSRGKRPSTAEDAEQLTELRTARCSLSVV